MTEVIMQDKTPKKPLCNFKAIKVQEWFKLSKDVCTIYKKEDDNYATKFTQLRENELTIHTIYVSSEALCIRLKTVTIEYSE